MKYSQKIVLEAIKDSGGIKKNICAKLDCSRPTLDAYIANDPVIAEAFIDEKEKLKDIADERLIEQIQMGNLGAIIWYQKTQCRDRGYVERTEQDITERRLIVERQGFASTTAYPASGATKDTEGTQTV